MKLREASENSLLPVQVILGRLKLVLRRGVGLQRRGERVNSRMKRRTREFTDEYSPYSTRTPVVRVNHCEFTPRDTHPQGSLNAACRNCDIGTVSYM